MIKKILFSFLFLSFFSCVKDVEEQKPQQVHKKIFTISIDGKLKYKYNYSGDLLSDIWTYKEDGSLYSKYEYTRPQENKLMVKLWYDIIGWSPSDYIIYTYDNSGLVTLRESYEADGTYKGKAVYTNRDTDAYNLTSATYFDQYNNETFRYDVEYTSENGSSISKYYENDELFMTQTWIRDDKMGAYFATDVFPYQHVNNTLSLEARYTSGTIASYSFTSVMEYDADDYPIKETMTKYNGTVSIFTFEYL